MVRVRNKKVILELLNDGVGFEKIKVVTNLEQDEFTKKILSTANNRNIPIENASYKKMDKRRSGETHEAVIGFLARKKFWGLEELLSHLYKQDATPFFLLLNKIEFASNVGVVARTALAAGVNGLLFQESAESFFNDETVHFSTGAIARIPLVKITMFDALKKLKQEGIKLCALDMKGEDYFTENLLGPVAFVLGDEKDGVSEQIKERCDTTLSIPMRQGIDSLNVAASASIVLYEKVRQEKAAR